MKKIISILLYANLLAISSMATASSFSDIESIMMPKRSVSGKYKGNDYDADRDISRTKNTESSTLSDGVGVADVDRDISRTKNTESSTLSDGVGNEPCCDDSLNGVAGDIADNADGNATPNDRVFGANDSQTSDAGEALDPYAWNDGLGGADVPPYTGSVDSGLFEQNAVYTSTFIAGANGAIPLMSSHLLDLNNPPSLKSSSSKITYIEKYILAGGIGNRGTLADPSSIFYSQNDGDVLRFVLKLMGFQDWQINLMMAGKWDIPSEAYAYMNDIQSQSALNLALNPVPLSVMTLSGVAFESGHKDGLTPTARWGSVSGMIEGNGKLIAIDGCMIRTATPTVKTSVSTTHSGNKNTTITTTRDVNILVDTISGSPTECIAVDGGGSQARYGTINAIAGNALLTIIADGNAIRRIDMGTATTTTISGQYENGGFRDGNLKDALFNMPGGVATDGTDVFVSDTGNNMIRRLHNGKVYTVAGNLAAGNADGKAGDARFDAPTHLYAQGTFLIVYDSNNSAFRRVDLATSVVTTLPGSYPNVTAIAFNGNNLFFASEARIYVMNLKTGKVSIVAGDGQNKHTDGIAGAAQFTYISAMYADGFDLWVFDGQTLRVIIGAGVSGAMPAPGH